MGIVRQFDIDQCPVLLGALVRILLQSKKQTARGIRIGLAGERVCARDQLAALQAALNSSIR